MPAGKSNDRWIADSDIRERKWTLYRDCDTWRSAGCPIATVCGSVPIARDTNRTDQSLVHVDEVDLLNRPLSPIGNDIDSGGTSWDADRDPQFRLHILWVAALLPVLAIAGRVAQLQLSLRDNFSTAFSRTQESIEEIPARDGRIFAADGSVLADDIEQFDIAVYYPAIEDPPDAGWIERKALPRLSKSDRKDKEKLAAEKARVIGERDTFWERLADIADRSHEEVAESRQREQARVERMKASVRRQYRERQQTADPGGGDAHVTAGLTWSSFWHRLQSAIAETPATNHGPHLIAEELGYHTVISNIDSDVKDEIEAHPQKYPYTQVVVRRRRTYPQKELASQLIGIRKPLTDEQFQARRATFPDGDPLDYHVGDPCGIGGLERSYDAVLKGVRGRRMLVKRRGEIVETRIIREPKHGRDLALTLYPASQLKAEELLEDALAKVTIKGTIDSETSHGATRNPTCPKGGSLVAIDIETGAILAAASAPRSDLNLQLASDPMAWEDVISDTRSPRGTLLARRNGGRFSLCAGAPRNPGPPRL